MYLGFVGFPCKFRAMNCTIIVLAGVALCVASVFLQTEALTKDPLLDNRNNKQIDERTKHVHHQHRCRTLNRQRRSIWEMFIQSIASAGETFHVKPILVDGVNDAENFGKLFKSKFHNNPKSANVMLSEGADTGEKTLTPKNKPNELNKKVGKGESEGKGEKVDMSNEDQETQKKKTQKKVEQSESEAEGHGEKAPMTENKANELNKEVGTTPAKNKATTKKFGDSEDMSNEDQETQKKVEQSESEAERHGEKAPMTENKPNELNNTVIPKTPLKVKKSPPKKTYKPYTPFIKKKFVAKRFYQHPPSTYITEPPTPPSPLVQRVNEFIKILTKAEEIERGMCTYVFKKCDIKHIFSKRLVNLHVYGIRNRVNELTLIALMDNNRDIRKRVITDYHAIIKVRKEGKKIEKLLREERLADRFAKDERLQYIKKKNARWLNFKTNKELVRMIDNRPVTLSNPDAPTTEEGMDSVNSTTPKVIPSSKNIAPNSTTKVVDTFAISSIDLATTRVVPPSDTSVVPPSTTIVVPPSATSVVPPSTTIVVPPSTTIVVPPSTTTVVSSSPT